MHLKATVCALLLTTTAPIWAAPGNPAPADYSGIYDCKGKDAHDGAYTAEVTLTKAPEHSVGNNTAYHFEMKVPGFGTYPGEAVAQGHYAAIHFANTDPKTGDAGTGLARFHKVHGNRWAFTKFYYEPGYQGGNHGTEDCVQKDAVNRVAPPVPEQSGRKGG